MSKHTNIEDVTRTTQRQDSLAVILNSLDAMIYVADMQTYEVLFVNQYGKSIWGDIEGKTCWRVLQADQDSPCSFCTNDYLLDEFGEPVEAYVWEFRNTVNGRWYQCRDQVIRWTDGRFVRLEIATDITDRKRIEEELLAAKLRAEELAQKDELTRLSNRRAFFEKGHQIVEQAKRFGHSTSLIMMDLDYFKKINDSHGHPVGDRVLQAVAELLQSLVREIDIVARMGGEEFALALPETSIEDAGILAERIRCGIENLVIADGDNRITLTASFGVATYEDDIASIYTLLSNADDALYVAKMKGRNQIRSTADLA